jgi:hypothetical protein
MRGVMRRSIRENEGGFILVWALLIMVVLLILGVSGIGTSIFESLMTVNDALHKQSFYQSDGGTQTAGMLIEENVSCPGGFQASMGPGAALIEGNIVVSSLTLAKNDNTITTSGSGHTGLPIDTPTATLRDAYYFYDATDPTGKNLPRTNIRAGGVATGSPGSSYIMGSGYEGGPGKSLAKGGGVINYDTYAQYMNVRSSESIVEIIWQHVIGFEGTCNKY